MKKLLSKVNQSYDKEFNKSLYEQFEDYLNHGISDYKEKVTNAYLKLKSTIPQNNNNNTIDINILKKEFDVIKNSKNRKCRKNSSYNSRILNKIKNDLESDNSMNNSKNFAKIKEIYHHLTFY